MRHVGAVFDACCPSWREIDPNSGINHPLIDFRVFDAIQNLLNLCRSLGVQTVAVDHEPVRHSTDTACVDQHRSRVHAIWFRLPLSIDIPSFLRSALDRISLGRHTERSAVVIDPLCSCTDHIEHTVADYVYRACHIRTVY